MMQISDVSLSYSKLYVTLVWQIMILIRKPSQCFLHNAPIFRLLLKVAVNGTHQCDFLNFCGDLGPQLIQSISTIKG